MKKSEIITQFLNYIDNCQKQYDYAYEKVGIEDRRTSDLLHELEIENTTSNERSKLATKLRNSRRDRRYWKDIVEECEPIINFANVPVNKKVINQLKQLLGEVRKVENYHSTRTYIPKVEKEKSSMGLQSAKS